MRNQTCTAFFPYIPDKASSGRYVIPSGPIFECPLVKIETCMRARVVALRSLASNAVHRCRYPGASEALLGRSVDRPHVRLVDFDGGRCAQETSLDPSLQLARKEPLVSTYRTKDMALG